ncbi:S41 family peptidase [Enterococcus sp. LJL98]
MEKNTVPFHRYLISMVCVAIISGGLVHTFSGTSRLQESGQTQADELEKVHTLFDSIQRDYYEVVDPKILVDGALKGMTEALEDPYTSYFNSEDSGAFADMLSGEFEGIGATLSLKDEQPYLVEEPVKSSPAAKSALQMGDVIVKVDGKSTKGAPLSETVSWIRGEKGTSVVLTILRDGETFEVEVIRDIIPIESVFYALDDKDSTIGKIEIITFAENTAMKLQKAIESLRNEGAIAFILDVRGNPGGYLDQVEVMASMFLADDAIILQLGTKDEIIGEIKASAALDRGFKVQEPVVVLVDGASASASEILAAALQESAGIPVVGTNTFGKGTVQGVRSFEDQSELKMTMQKWLTPNGNWLNEVGLSPDVRVDFPDYAYLPTLVQNNTLQLGDTNEQAEQLNQFLVALGYLEKVGDTFTNQTSDAIEAFQEENELPVTGRLDLETMIGIELRLAEQLQKTDPMYQKAIEVLLESKK